MLDLPEPISPLPVKHGFIHFHGQPLARRSKSEPPLEASSGADAASTGQVRADETIALPMTPRREVMSPERPHCPTPSQKSVGTQTPKNMLAAAQGEGSPQARSPQPRRSFLSSGLEDGNALTPAYAYRQRTASTGSCPDF